MKNLPIEVLRAFVTIVELGSFTQAGDLLGRSQPAISLQIKRLEEMLDQKLISRNGQNIELTKLGEQLFYYAKRILALNDEAVASFGATSVSGQLKLGIPSEFATTLLPKVLSRFANTYPNVNLEVMSDLSRNLINAGGQKQYDLMLVLHDDPQKAGSSLIKEDELVWVSSHSHDCHMRSVLPLIVAPEGCIYRNRASTRLAEAALPWKISYTNPSLSGIQAAIEEGLGVTVLAKSSVPDGLKVITNSTRLPKLGKIGISMVKQASDQNEAAQRLCEYISASLS
ncbi:LysR substrate-binding domain-containing protein [Pseudoteredinibacter isoporae]|uniref:DNA-binding transcriptional LysR family regulator n=1 Tax=Pseudoteredinibacter isoporae TaxID=570281 RepID=A0A7X0JUK2_9GAMM|nr:LysR substrate-binding domain-containing protein [Pseudoteredinibacter isoporae]MBB6521710.1 DNA-binding transcriptional LysR family regulator [Pseudoteredinibacter isoporae]NHO87258.1 LysR family transcriptional regulator [Pseudoteredinibacter isoporae]NIB23110.1 LysR family transcriptional regulator [Pseudoteredinibacter isoporae]